MTMPRTSARYEVGEYVYVPQRNCNMPVSRIDWRNNYGILPHWHVSVPGLGGDQINFGEFNPYVPTVHFEEIGHCWRPVITDLPATYYS